MKIKTSNLTGAALDWAVALAADMKVVLWRNTNGPTVVVFPFTKPVYPAFANPSTDWGLGGPIIEGEKIELSFDGAEGGVWGAVSAYNHYEGNLECGPTPLVAAMRLYVAHKLGDEVEIPEELL